MECLFLDSNLKSYDICDPKTIQKIHTNLNKPDIYFFQYIKTGGTMSVHHKIVDDKIYIELSWENILNYGTFDQIQNFDKFRVNYINFLLQKYCNKNTTCVSERIGKVTAFSDIDINIENYLVENKFKYNIHEIIKNIYRHHYKLFKLDLDRLFDTNLYGVAFKFYDNNTKTFYIPDYKTNYSQRIWSCLRLAMISKNQIFNIGKYMNTNLLSDATHKLHKLSELYGKKHRINTYIKNVEIYYGLISKNASMNKIIQVYSLCKYLENDAYYSVGAYLHIVLKVKNLDDPKLLDSVYDNMGFMIFNFFKYDDPLKKLEKIAKYLLRITDAINQMQSVKNRDLSIKVYNICNEAITQKKHLKKLESLDQYEYALRYFQDNINMVIANKAKITIKKTLEYIIKMIFHEINIKII